MGSVVGKRSVQLADGKRDFTATPAYPPDDGTNRLKRSDSVNTGNGTVTVTMNCYITYPSAQPSQVKGHCTIQIPVQTNAQSCAKYRFMPSASCTERFPTTDPNYVP
ncbi:MAG: hypothetical protein HY925_03810, partial [Elusimicrobia bacterium]|nr:hypothetical protein [Elusimicrobiota bacterium]